jgi:dTDP-4-dehydrorhamnose 3,5-epimerase
MATTYKDFVFKSPNEIKDLKVIEFSKFEDHRGSLFTTYLRDQFFENDIPLELLHDKYAMNFQKGVLRGFHGDFKSWKLVTALTGKIFQAVYDNRPNSSTYGNSYTTEIDSENGKLVLIPPGCANGFQTLKENTLYHYKLAYPGEYSDAEDQFTLPWNSNEININWPISKPILSKRDENASNQE